MPLFEYICRDCRHHFESLVHHGATPSCPACKGTQLEKQLSVFAVGSSPRGPAAADMAAPCGRCGDPRGPGACSLN